MSVRTQMKGVAHESECERPMRALTMGKLHQARIRQIPPYQDHDGTVIRIFGYNQNQRAEFVQAIVKDYICWFTKFGSVEAVFGPSSLAGFKIDLKCLDADQFETLTFGHPFPEENSEINELFEQHGSNAASLFVKRYFKRDRLEKLPEVTFDMVVSVEGDAAKRSYNQQIRERRRKETGRYKVSDRYGLWLCKDFIPVERVNEWIVGFGTGSNAFTLLHGFVNCQRLKLTANRGSVGNTDPSVVEELKRTVQAFLDEIDADLKKNGIYTLFEWQSEERTLAQERADFDSRTKSIEKRRAAKIDGRRFYEPRNESELFGIFMAVQALHPELFEFEPVDYNTTRGIDMIGRNKSGGKASEAAYWYIELKHTLSANLNHGFRHLRWLVCWDFDEQIDELTEFGSTQETEVRRLVKAKGSDGTTVYFLDSQTAAVKIQVIRLKEFLLEHLEASFE